MILSLGSLFSDDQVITATAASTNKYDTGVRGTPYDGKAPLNGDVGLGCPVPILVQVTETFNTLTSLTITLENGPNADLSSATVLASETILLADLVAGKKTHFRVLPADVTKRYLGLRYTVTGTAPTLGKISAGITMGVQSNITGA